MLKKTMLLLIFSIPSLAFAVTPQRGDCEFPPDYYGRTTFKWEVDSSGNVKSDFGTTSKAMYDGEYLIKAQSSSYHFYKNNNGLWTIQGSNPNLSVYDATCIQTLQ